MVPESEKMETLEVQRHDSNLPRPSLAVPGVGGILPGAPESDRNGGRGLGPAVPPVSGGPPGQARCIELELR